MFNRYVKLPEDTRGYFLVYIPMNQSSRSMNIQTSRRSYPEVQGAHASAKQFADGTLHGNAELNKLVNGFFLIRLGSSTSQEEEKIHSVLVLSDTYWLN